MKNVIIAASILASDFSNLQREVKRAEDAGADWLHLDVMDGHFVDNISFGPAFVAAIKKSTILPIDVHLMIERPDDYFSRFVGSANNITVHVEAEHKVEKTLLEIREAGCTAGLAINPTTPFEAVMPYLDIIDLLLVMTVQPGFGGQSFKMETMVKVETAVAARREKKLNFHIEVDGGINAITAPISIQKGANVLVAGSSLFGVADMAAAILSLRQKQVEEH